MLSIALAVVLVGIAAYHLLIQPLFLSPESRIPGPRLFALTKWRLAVEDYRGTRTRTIDHLHGFYGSAIRIGPAEIHFNSLSALRTIYGAGSGYQRTGFYRMFDVYGRQNLFTFHSVREHAARKKMLANAYSKSAILKGANARMVESKVKQYMDLIAGNNTAGIGNEIFGSLHYFSLDSITAFLYGRFGGTEALAGNPAHRALLTDILDPARRKLSWFAVHLPKLTKWLYTRTSLLERMLQPFLPMAKPATYTGIRAHALNSYYSFSRAALSGDADVSTEPTIVAQLWKAHVSQKEGGLADLDVASECADHLLAGIDTTADTLMFLIWAISRPHQAPVQEKLIAEVQAIPPSDLNEHGAPKAEAADKLPYLNAIIKETLRLYLPLPASEPRSLPTDSIIDGHTIPARTTVGMSPYSLHRNPDVFQDPLEFSPERWLGSEEEVKQMSRWFWAFSSGGRMCIGLHLAMAEMTTLVAAVYRRYRTVISKGLGLSYHSRLLPSNV